MVGIETGLRLVGGVLLLLANGFFVTTEFAMTRVPQFPAEEFTDSGSRGLERAWEVTSLSDLEDPLDADG
jgi:CBS domain containing-hemolysin-like protein